MVTRGGVGGQAGEKQDSKPEVKEEKVTQPEAKVLHSTKAQEKYVSKAEVKQKSEKAKPKVEKTVLENVEESEKDPEPEIAVNHLRCPTCSRNVPISNFELHSLRCEAQVLRELQYFKEEEAKADSVKPKKAKTKKPKKEKEPEDDFAAVCAEFQQLDTVCNYPRTIS